jgi:hypothetical protein
MGKNTLSRAQGHRIQAELVRQLPDLAAQFARRLALMEKTFSDTQRRLGLVEAECNRLRQRVETLEKNREP